MEGHGFREDFFRNSPTRNKNGLWPPCLLMDRDEMGNLDRGPSIDASCKMLLYLARKITLA
jgi:hypothetical protein